MKKQFPYTTAQAEVNDHMAAEREMAGSEFGIEANDMAATLKALRARRKQKQQPKQLPPDGCIFRADSDDCDGMIELERRDDAHGIKAGDIVQTAAGDIREVRRVEQCEVFDCTRLIVDFEVRP